MPHLPPPSPAFPTPSYLAARLTPRQPATPLAPAASPAPPPAPSAHVPHASYSSRTLVLDHMLFLSTTTRVRQLERVVGPVSSASGGIGGGGRGGQGSTPAELDQRLGYTRQPYRRAPPPPPTSAASMTTTARGRPSPSTPAPVDVDDGGESLEDKAAGYERMLSVLLERVRLASGVSTPVPELDSDDDDDDYIVSPEAEVEDDLLPEGVRLRLGLAGIVDVLSRADAATGASRPTAAAVATADPTPSAAQHRTVAALAALLPSKPDSITELPARTAALFARGASPPQAAASPGPSSPSARTPTGPTPTRRSSLSAFSTVGGLAPAPERWYDLPDPSSSAAAATAASAAAADAGRWVELLERLLVLSAALAEAVGGSTVEEEERRRGRRPRVGPAGAQRSGGPAAGGRGPQVRPSSALWESDSEESVDERLDEDGPADGGPTEASRLGQERHVSGSPARRPSASSFADAHAGNTPPPPASAPDRALTARPTRAWFALVSAVLVQAVLAGFLEQAWVGLADARAILLLGAGTCGAPEAGDGGGEALARARWVLFGGAGGRGGHKRTDEFAQVAEANWHELTAVAPGTPDLRTHLAALAHAHPAQPVEHAVLQFVAAATAFLGTPELARVAPAPSADSASRRLSLSSLLNPSGPSPRSAAFPTYQQEPPTPPADPSRAPRRQGINRFFVAPRLRRTRDHHGTAAVAVAGVKRLREGEGEEEGERERERSRVADLRPPIIVVEDWPDPYGVHT